VLQEPYGSKPGWEAAPSHRFGPWMRELMSQATTTPLPVTIGLDLGSRTSQFAICSPAGDWLGQGKVATTSTGIRGLLAKYRVACRKYRVAHHAEFRRTKVPHESTESHTMRSSAARKCRKTTAKAPALPPENLP
jgi:hypothetical protein